MKASLLASHLSAEPISTQKQQIGVRLRHLALKMFDTLPAQNLCAPAIRFPPSFYRMGRQKK